MSGRADDVEDVSLEVIEGACQKAYTEGVKYVILFSPIWVPAVIIGSMIGAIFNFPMNIYFAFYETQIASITSRVWESNFGILEKSSEEVKEIQQSAFAICQQRHNAYFINTFEEWVDNGKWRDSPEYKQKAFHIVF